MTRKYEIKVDRTGRGRSFTVVNKETGAVIGTSGVTRPGVPTVSAATIRKKDPPKDFVFPKRKVVAKPVEDEDEDTGMEEAQETDLAVGRIAGTTREERMQRSIAGALTKRR